MAKSEVSSMSLVQVRLRKLKRASNRGSSIAKQSLSLFNRKIQVSGVNKLQKEIEEFKDLLMYGNNISEEQLEIAFEKFSSVCRIYDNKCLPAKSLESIINLMNNDQLLYDLYGIQASGEIIESFILNPNLNKESLSTLIRANHGFGSFIAGYEGEVPYHLLAIARNPMYEPSVFRELVDRNSYAYGLELLRNPTTPWSVINRIDLSLLTYPIRISGLNVFDSFPKLCRELAKTAQIEDFDLGESHLIDGPNKQKFALGTLHLMMLFQRISVDIQDQEISVEKLLKLDNLHINLCLALLPQQRSEIQVPSKYLGHLFNLQPVADKIYERKIWQPFN